MRNFKLVVEYDGTDFHGWQRQPGMRTVQGTLEEAVDKIFGQEVTVNGAGRTDAGVHALGQVGNVVIDTTLSAYQIGKAVAANLPEDIHIKSVDEAAPDFHARFSARSRRYVYYVRTEPSAIWRRFAHVVTVPLAVEPMKDAASRLVGEKDFSSFTPTRSAGVPTVCNVTEASVEQDDEIISVTLEADHFLHHMVRVIVGTLIDVGRGHIATEHVDDILGRKDRRAAGPTTPPNGLFLTGVRYED